MKRHPSRLIRTPLDELTYQIIGCAMAVHGRRGPGFREEVYQADMEEHLKAKGFAVAAEQPIEVYDTNRRDVLLGFYIPDLVVEGKVVVELKALFGLDDSHVAQVIGYLAITGCEVGLLINFGKNKLQFKRILPPKDAQEHHLNRQWLWVPDWLRYQHSEQGIKIQSEPEGEPSAPFVPSALSVPSDPQSASSSAPPDPFIRRPCLTQAEYLSVALSTNRIVEWSDGELIEHPLGTVTHQLAVGALLSALTKYVARRKLGTVLMAAFAVKLWDGKFRAPDVLFISTTNHFYLQEECCEHPDLVIEVVSPFTHELDRVTKRREYAQADIPEYWIVDPQAKILTVLKLSGKSYEVHGEYEHGTVAESALLNGFQVNVSKVFDASH
jgi:GxxExxY protein